MSANVLPRITPEEYLAIERAADHKSEYFDGRVYAMSGCSLAHARITFNLNGVLYDVLEGKDCWATSNDLRLQVSSSGLYTYPDAMITCGEPQLADHYKDVLLNPTVIVEVLSPSTEAHDRGFKFAQYRLLESLREYVLVSQTEPRVEIFRRQSDGEFKLSESVGMDTTCHLASIDCRLPMSKIYRGITFPS